MAVPVSYYSKFNRHLGTFLIWLYNTFLIRVISLTTNKNGIRSSKSKWKEPRIWFNFLIFCRYLNLVQTENQHVAKTLKFWTYGGNIRYYHWTLYLKVHFCRVLRGNNSCKTYNFRIRVRNVQMVYFINIR